MIICTKYRSTSCRRTNLSWNSKNLRHLLNSSLVARSRFFTPMEEVNTPPLNSSVTTTYGILYEKTASHMPAHNGLAEVINCIVIEWIWSMLYDVGLSTSFWAEATLTAVYLINWSPTLHLPDAMPEMAQSGIKFNIRIFWLLQESGCKDVLYCLSLAFTPSRI